MSAATPPGIDREPVTRWFVDHVPGVLPPLGFRVVAGGRSNLTYHVTDADGRAWALRRPPLHAVLASAHDVGREHRVMSALGPTPVPVPRTVGHCADDSVTGAPFAVTEWVDGHVLRDEAAVAAALSGAEDRRRVAEALVDALVAIHAVDPDAVGLGDLGRKEGYVQRQLRRWHGQWQQSRTRELPLIDEVHARLSACVPEQGPATIVHGDFRLDNAIVGADGSVRAVLDWELCTLGDPLADVGLLVVYWAKPFGEVPTGAPGFPTAETLTRRYAERSGRDLSDLGFYVALGSWKLAVILEGVHARSTAGAYGTPADEGDDLPAAVDRLAQAAADALES